MHQIVFGPAVVAWRLKVRAAEADANRAVTGVVVGFVILRFSGVDRRAGRIGPFHAALGELQAKLRTAGIDGIERIVPETADCTDASTLAEPPDTP